MKKIPVLIYTDIGDDIDDSLAISYLAYCDDIHIVGIICDSRKNNYRKDMTKKLLNILDYQTSILGSQHKRVLKNILTTYGKDLVILSIASNKRLKKDMEDFPILFGNIKRIYFQGHVYFNNKKIFADMHSYNFTQDPESIKYILEYKIPMTFVGKYIAYEAPITKDYFTILSQNNPSVCNILYQRAQEWKTKFKKLNPEIFEKLYGKDSNIMSYPYDLITAIVINKEKMFIKNSIGKIDLIGQEKNQKGIKNISEFKKYIINIFKKH
ncbi:MAG: hypothetical protein WAZ12_01225 [Candidatus Absconditicoccaceae bacterium]